MLGLITFPLADVFVKLLSGEPRKEIGKDLLRILVFGFFVMLGFACAFLIHADLRGDGQVWEGVKAIIKEDVLRSTLYRWTADYGEAYQVSMSASLWKVLTSYFHRPEEIISGVDGSYFPLLAAGPIIIFLYNGIKNKIEFRDCFLYGITFITSVSWFVLGKSHSAMHGFLNFVLWNFGYVQICLYVILKQFIQWMREVG